MKKVIFALLIGAAFVLAPVTASAHEYDRDDEGYPLRYVAYALHPVGIAAEYLVLRPIHWLVSQPNLDIIFGHDSYESPDYDYFKWE